MASSLPVYDTGYEDELFQYPVGPSLHCCICTNVIKDAVMCGPNEHIFCRACITRHLMNYQTCPTCMDPLTVETLRQATRGIRNLLAELKIRCEFFDRGCGKFIELGDLERHVTECGFAPAVCSNEGCQDDVNKQDLLHHETVVCQRRRVQCHNCKDILQEMDTMKVNLAAMSEKLEKNEKNVLKNGIVVENVALVQEQLRKQLSKQEESNHRQEESNRRQEESNRRLVESSCRREESNRRREESNRWLEESNRRLQADNAEIKKSLSEIMKQLERITQHVAHEVHAKEMKKGISGAGATNRELKVVIAGGGNPSSLKSVEMFSLLTRTWTLLQPMNECHAGASSVIHNNQLFVVGGRVNSMEKLSLNAVQGDQSIPWEMVPAELPGRLAGHCSVVFNGRLIVIGGYIGDKNEYSNSITEISIVSPYISKLLTTMSQRRRFHGVAIFDDKILIFGGVQGGSGNSSLRSVVMYDITKNKCQELAPLPYPVYDMATVRCDDYSVLIMGGADSHDKPLNKVLIYNVKTQKSRMLPDMKYNRRGCVAAVVRDTAIVIGGHDGSNYLKSVESLRFDSFTWEELPQMNEARYIATAALC